MEKSRTITQEKTADSLESFSKGSLDNLPSAVSRKSFKIKKMLMIILLILAFPLVTYYSYNWIAFRLNYVVTEDAQVKSDLIIISSKVGGRLTELLVDEGESVLPGQQMLVLEAKEYREEVARAAAIWENLKSELEKAQINLQLIQKKVTQGLAEAKTYLSQSKDSLEMAREDTRLREEKAKKEVERAEANYHMAQARAIEIKSELEKAKREAVRAEALFREGILSETDRDNRETELKTFQARFDVVTKAEMETRAAYESSQSDLRTVTLKKQQEKVVEASQKVASIQVNKAEDEMDQIAIQELMVKALQARIKEAKANYNLAALKLEETSVTSPEEGIIARRLVRLGEIVQPGQPLLVINNPKRVWIVANLEETKMGNIRDGNEVLVQVDAYPEMSFSGKVGFIGSAATSELALISADNPSRNFIKVIHRLPVRVILENSNGFLRPGMNVNVAIKRVKP